LSQLLKTALHSHQVRSLLAALIAQANQAIEGSPNVAIAAVKHGRDGTRIDYCRIHLPFGGHFGSPVTDARRDSVVEMVKTEGKKVVTIRGDGVKFTVVAAVRLTPKGYLRIDENNDLERDDLGELPEIDQLMTRRVVEPRPL
jgi:hypothetical protein